MRQKREINLFTEELEGRISVLEQNKHLWEDQRIPEALIEENKHRLETLEWVMEESEDWPNFPRSGFLSRERKKQMESVGG